MRTPFVLEMTLALASFSAVSLAQPAPADPQPPAAPPAAQPAQPNPPAPVAPADAPAADPAGATTPPAPAAGAAAPAATTPVDEAAAAAEPLTTQAGPPLPAQVAAAPAPAEPPAPPPSDRVSVAKQGFFKPGVLIQSWYLLQERGDDDITHQFRLRRAEFKASGEIVPGKVAYKIMADFAKVFEFQERSIDVEYDEGAPDAGGSVSIAQPARQVSALQDVEVTFKSRYADVTAGQYKIPISYEALKSSSALMLPERPAVTRRYGDFRDLGVRAEKKIGPFYYYAGLFNGSGQNRADNDNDKGVSLRVQLTPVEGVTLGAAGYATLGERESDNTKDIIEGDLILEFGDLLAQAEYIHGFTGPDSGVWEESHGFYAAVGYELFDVLQPVVRVGYIDPEVTRDLVSTDDEDEVWTVEGGLNCFISERNVMISAMANSQIFEEGGSDFEGILALQLSY